MEVQGYNNVTAFRGIRDLVLPVETDSYIVAEEEDYDSGKKLSINIPELKDYRDRAVRGDVDLRYSLSWMDDMDHGSMVLGRSWRPVDRDISFRRLASTWGDRNLEFQPAIAGVNAAVKDRANIAVGNAAAAFFPKMGNQLTFDSLSMARVGAMQLREYNPVRYVWRLAALYLRTKFIEETGAAPVIANVDEPSVTYISQLSGYEAALQICTNHSHIIPYKPAVYTERDLSAARILGLALSDKIEWVDEACPGIMKKLPPMPDTQLWVIGERGNISWGGRVESFDVLDAAIDWCQEYASVGMFTECVDSIMALSYAPSGMDNLSCGLSLALPNFKGTALIAAPFCMSLREQKDEFDEERLNDYRRMSVRGAQIARFMGIAEGCVMQEQGLFAMAFESAANLPIKRQKHNGDVRAWCSRANTCSAVRKMGPILRKYGINLQLGRILSTCAYRISGTDGLLQHVNNVSSRGVQWEEVLLDAPKIPDTASILGKLRPLRSDGLVQPGYWHSVKSIPGYAKNPAAFINGIKGHVDELEIGLWIASEALESRVGLESKVFEVPNLLNYAGRVADWQTYETLPLGDAKATLVARLANKVQSLALARGDPFARTRRWVVDSVLDIDDIVAGRIQNSSRLSV